MTVLFEKTVEIVNQRGLHARASAKFVRLVEQHQADVTVTKDDISVSGASIMGLLMLSASLHTQIRIAVRGQEAAAVLKELTDLVGRKFDEE